MHWNSSAFGEKKIGRERERERKKERKKERERSARTNSGQWWRWPMTICETSLAHTVATLYKIDDREN